MSKLRLRIRTETNLLILLISVFSVVTVSAIPTQASTQGAPAVFMAHDGTIIPLELKATKGPEGPEPIEDFELTADNVLSIPLNDKVVISADTGVEYTGAKITPTSTPDTTVDIPITSGVISFAGVASGIYTLDVIITDQFAYEGIVVVGGNVAARQITNIIQNTITEINQETDVDVRKSFDKGKVKKVLDKEQICLFTPSHPVCAPVDGNCPKNFAMNEDGNCYPNKIKCPNGYWRADDDETGACVPIPERPIYDADSPFCTGPQNAKHIGCPAYYEGKLPLTPELPCTEGSTYDPTKGECILDSEATPTPTPTPTPGSEPTTCEAGFILENGVCAELSSNCGGQPCTASQKEDSTTSDPIQGTSEPTPDAEPDVEEEEDVDIEDDPVEEEDIEEEPTPTPEVESQGN
jgi:hypothetical protein